MALCAALLYKKYYNYLELLTGAWAHWINNTGLQMLQTYKYWEILQTLTLNTPQINIPEINIL